MPEEITQSKHYIPLEALDISVPTEDIEYFTVGIIVEYVPPQASQRGKVFSKFSICSLAKYDMSRLKKHVIQKYFQERCELTYDQAQIDAKVNAALKSWNTDGYKAIRVLAFGDELTKQLHKKIGVVGMVIALVDLKPLDFSNNSGQSFRIHEETQTFCLGKSEELIFCSGVKTKTSTPLPLIGLNQNQTCERFLNKSFDKACEKHKLVQAESKLTQIRSGRQSLHSDFIDLNMTAK